MKMEYGLWNQTVDSNLGAITKQTDKATPTLSVSLSTCVKCRYINTYISKQCYKDH